MKRRRKGKEKVEITGEKGGSKRKSGKEPKVVSRKREE